MAKKRQTLMVPGIHHGANPIPSGVRIGNMVFSGGISGQDPDNNNQLPPEPERQAALAFQNMARLMEAVGGSTDDIGHVTVFLKDLALREFINSEWVKMFPNADDRPTRHTLRYDLAAPMLLQLEIIGVIT